MMTYVAFGWQYAIRVSSRAHTVKRFHPVSGEPVEVGVTVEDLFFKLDGNETEMQLPADDQFWCDRSPVGLGNYFEDWMFRRRRDRISDWFVQHAAVVVNVYGGKVGELIVVPRRSDYVAGVIGVMLARGDETDRPAALDVSSEARAEDMDSLGQFLKQAYDPTGQCRLPGLGYWLVSTGED